MMEHQKKPPLHQGTMVLSGRVMLISMVMVDIGDDVIMMMRMVD